MSRTLTALFAVGICSVLCFAKQNFQVIIERAEVTDINTEIINASIRVNKYNRTCKAVSCNFTLLQDLGYDGKVELRLFALYSNEYRRTPAVLTRNVCDFYKMEYLWAKTEIDKYSNFPAKCPTRAGYYYLKDFVLDGAAVPAVANFPWTSVMIHIRMFHKDTIYYGVKVYATLDHDVELKRLG